MSSSIIFIDILLLGYLTGLMSYCSVDTGDTKVNEIKLLLPSWTSKADFWTSMMPISPLEKLWEKKCPTAKDAYWRERPAPSLPYRQSFLYANANAWKIKQADQVILCLTWTDLRLWTQTEKTQSMVLWSLGAWIWIAICLLCQRNLVGSLEAWLMFLQSK